MEELNIKIDGKEIKVKVEETEERKLKIYTGGEKYEVEIEPSSQDKELDKLVSGEESENTGEIKAPIPGVISKIKVKKGDSIKKGDKILSFLAMKMENEVKAPIEGKIKEIFVKEGSNFNKGDKLVLIE